MDAMNATERFTEKSASPWIVSHRQFEMGSSRLSAFSTADRAYLYAAGLIREEIAILFELDAEAGEALAQALEAGRYEEAVRLYHEVEGNLEPHSLRQLELEGTDGLALEPIRKPSPAGV